MLGELPALIAAGYADIPEEDIVRLKWWGLYHDKPKVGTFMLRIKLPAGRMSVAQLRTIGELSVEHGSDVGELSTRQTIQLHSPPAAGAAGRLRPPRLSGADDRGGLRRRGPQRHRLSGRGPRRRRALRRDAGDRRGDELLLRQPGLQRPAAQAQDHDLDLRTPVQRCRDQLHRARRRDPRRRRGLRGPRRRRALVGAAARPRARRLRRRRTRRWRCCARSSTPGRRTSATASRASRRGSSSWSTTSARRECARTSSSVWGAGCPTSASRRTR